MQERAAVSPEGAPPLDLDVTETGSGADLVVFVHGVLDRGRSFRQVAEQLATECRMLWYDRRGYGGSRDAAGADRSVSQHVDDLVAILAGRPAIVVGHSFGGVPAMGLAARAPELVRSLVLYETSAAWAPAWADEVMRGILASDDPEHNALTLILGDRLEGMSVAERRRWDAESLAFLGEERSVRQQQPPFRVADIRCPVLYGRSDPRIMPECVDYLQSEIPDFAVVEVPGAGHHGHRAAPADFADLVRRGLALARS